MKRALAVLCMVGGAAQADEVERPPLCFRGREACKAVVLAETSLGLEYSSSVSHGKLAFDGEVGLLLNTAPGGIGMSAGLRTVYPRDGRLDAGGLVRGRYRYWLTPSSAVEGSLGLLWYEGAPGGTGQLAYQLNSQIGFVVDLDVLSVEGDAWFEAGVSVRFSSYASLPAFLVSYVLALFAGAN